MNLGDYNPLDEQWRWCTYCKADCWLEPENQQHETTCPTVTGLYPVAVEDLEQGVVCPFCQHLFKAGDVYVDIDATTGRLVHGRSEDVTTMSACLGCAAGALDNGRMDMSKLEGEAA